MAELKRCPFCGGEAKLIDDDLSYVICTECGIHPYHRISLRDAIEAWNKRTSPWHTGTPTEKGWYLQRIKSKNYITYDTDYYENGDWKYSCVFCEILAWQKIEPYKEKEDGRTD